MKSAIATAATLFFLVRPGFAQPAQPTPAPTLPPANSAAQPAYPAYPYPPGYTYSPGYPYPPAYGYPPPSPYAPGYPPNPQGYSPYASPYPAYPPAYAQPTAAGYLRPVYAEPPPAPVPGGKWRLGATVMFVPQGTLAYNLIYRGEAQVAYSGTTAATAGIAAQLQIDLFRYLFAGFTLQYLPSISWNNPLPQPSTNTNPFGGSAHETDLLPQLGANIPVARRIRFQVFAAPGYSFLSVSGLTISKALIDQGGSPRGFLFQTGVAMNWSFG